MQTGERMKVLQFDSQFIMDHIDELIHLEEHVIFFKYTGERVPNAKKEEFYDKVKPITGEDAYDDAYAIRDKSIEKDLELK